MGVSDLHSESVWVPLLSIPGTLSLMTVDFAFFQEGTEIFGGMARGLWSSNLGSLFSRILLWWMKLDLLSLLSVGWLILASMGWL